MITDVVQQGMVSEIFGWIFFGAYIFVTYRLIVALFLLCDRNRDRYKNKQCQMSKNKEDLL